MNEKCPNCEKPLEGNNLQKCINCGIDIPKYIRTSLENLQRDKELLTNNEKRISNTISEMTWGKLKRRTWKIIGVTSILAIISLWQLYNHAISFANKRIEDLITKQFDEPRIKQTLTEVANTKAEDILMKQIRPEIDNLKAEINKELGSVKELAEDLKTKYAADYSSFNLEVVKLKDRNRLTELADMAISNRDVVAYSELEKIANDSTKPELIPAAVSEIKRIKTFFATMTSVKGLFLIQKGPLGTELKDNDIPTTGLISYLRNNNNWLARVKAAELLANRKEKGVPEVLIEIMKNDTNLEVRKVALQSFESITGYVSNDVFDFEAANEWWLKNKTDIDKKLK